ncbi:hypothetical protein [Mycobacterium phage SWU1]|uniref:Gene 30 protein n=2 Tax=Fromanvirus TaxID=186764 RepID=VG30_BPML5|nr:minor tail protein [Fromanvirus L5]YP_006382948.1 minor tail protein [Mycobacterium phage SWU1]Q05239.1 RecName: Full=Gene 30 protein; AltName: Full=Gp30 [Fromanvirus L5]AFI24938.1 hypothetical protein [Mycobacterium phage SWU1]CAA79406.1 Minor tail protein [Fromanvirus L5]
MTPFNPDSIGDYVTLLGVAFLTFSVPAWFTGRARKHSSDIGEIKEQVCNTHDTNLRDDLDSVKADISDLKEIVLQGFHQVNESINLERRERIEGDRRKEVA